MPHFITQVHKIIRAARLTKRHATSLPEDVPKFRSKEYPRMKRIELLEPQFLEMPVGKTLAERRSFDTIDDFRAPTLRELSDLLGSALRARSNRHRPYPSGGALFPVETYIFGDVLENESRGVYHYNPNLHVLEFLWESSVEMEQLFRRSQTSLPPATFLFTSVWGRGAAKYGDLTYYHSLIEVGHIAENLLLAGEALGFQMRPHSGFDDALVTELLDIDERMEQPIYALQFSPGKE